MPIGMNYVSTKEYAATHGIAERTVRNYCIQLKMFYYRGLHEWKRAPGYLTDTCLTA